MGQDRTAAGRVWALLTYLFWSIQCRPAGACLDVYILPSRLVVVMEIYVYHSWSSGDLMCESGVRCEGGTTIG